ncbi:MAG: hypothetical protein ABR579_03505 [Actinomycetota bacterium]
MAGRKVDLGLNLLDCQMVDRNGEPCGNVDDVEFEWSAEGSPPIVSALLCGPGALGPRVGGRLGRSIAALHARLTHGRPDPARVSMGTVSRITHQVEVLVDAKDLETGAVQKWALKTIIGKIPGAGHAPE